MLAYKNLKLKQISLKFSIRIGKMNIALPLIEAATFETRLKTAFYSSMTALKSSCSIEYKGKICSEQQSMKVVRQKKVKEEKVKKEKAAIQKKESGQE